MFQPFLELELLLESYESLLLFASDHPGVLRRFQDSLIEIFTCFIDFFV